MEHDQRERVLPVGDHFVLIALPSGEERLEPLVDLSPNGVTIMVRAHRSELATGAFLPRVRFFWNGECTLQCQATVQNVVKTMLDGSGIGMKVSLKLELIDNIAPSSPAVDTYTEPEIIADAVANLIRGTSKLRVHIMGDAHQRGLATVTIVRFARESNLVVARVVDGASVSLETGAVCELSGESYGTRLSLVAALTENTGDALCFAMPSRLAVWRHRVGGRVRSLPSGIEVSFESPFTKAQRSRTVVDLSARGLAFTGSPEDGLLLGMLLPTIIVRLPSGSVHARGVIRNVRATGDGLLVGIEFVSMPEASTKVLETFIDTNLHPTVRAATTSDIPRLWPVYEEAGMFARTHAAITAATPKIESVRRNLLSRARELVVHMVGGGDDTIYGSAELLHTYSSTWSIQHVCVRENAQQLTADQLVLPLVEAALRRKEFAQLHAIVDPERSRVGLARLRDVPPDEAGIYWVERKLFAEPKRGSTSGDVQEAGPGDLDWIGGRARETLSPLERSALDISVAELKLAKMNRLYAHVGLIRNRFVRMAFSVGGPIGFSLVEVTTPGVSFPGYTELARIYPTRREPSARRDALLALANDAIRVHRENRIERTQILVESADAPILEEAGFTPLGTRIELIATRNGASQIVNFINLLA